MLVRKRTKPIHATAQHFMYIVEFIFNTVPDINACLVLFCFRLLG